MRHCMLLLGIGTSLLASSACATPPKGPLAAAAVTNAADVVGLLAAGHPPDEAGDDGITPLMWAARSGATHSMTALLDAGADANADAPGGVTPLLMAAADRDPATVQALLEYGANPRAEGPGGTTPLTQAVSGGALTDIDRPLLGGCRRATVSALMTHDPTLRVARTAAGLQAIWWARFHGCAEVLQMIGEQPTKPGQTIVSLGGVLHQHVREIEPAVERRADQLRGKQPDPPTPTRARDVPSPR
jgi:hypothetical protein